MSDIAANNKRIAKNTALLYVRMLITLSVSLFTSRIVLNALGVEDFGINNVVAGMVTMFTFLNTTLSSGTQRFITFALGENDFKKLQSTFTTTFHVHLVLAVILGLVIFIAGMWLLNQQLNIPANRIQAAYYVFVGSIITVILGITQVPYLASIIAHENMKIYAYMSIFDAAAKLGVAYMLVITEEDKLKLYAILLTIIAFVNVVVYRVFCIQKYKECRVGRNFDWDLFKSIMRFSGWNVMGCSAVLCNNQGLNILLNLFGGPVLNAARGISLQVNGLASQFVGNFQTAVNPQIVKYFATNEREKMNRLIYNNARYAGLMVLFIIIPIIVEIDFLLEIWLGAVPSESAFFTRIILFQTYIQTMTRPVVMGIHATGKMRTVNILAGGVLLMVLPLTYVLLKARVTLHIVMLVSLSPWLIETFIEVILLRKYVGFSLSNFYKYVYVDTFFIGCLSIIPLFLIHQTMESGWIRMIVIGIVSTLWSGFLIYRFGINNHLREVVKNKMKDVVSKCILRKK